MMASVFLCMSDIGCEHCASKRKTPCEFNGRITFTWCHREVKLMTVSLELLLIQVQYLRKLAYYEAT